MLAYPGYGTRLKVEVGGTFVLDGVTFEATGEPIRTGDTYVAQGNTGPRILTAKAIHEADGFIVPKEIAYCYNTHACARVIVVREASEADRNAFTGPTDEDLRRAAAVPFDHNNPKSRDSRHIILRDWGAHQDHWMIASELVEVDGTWLAKGYIPGATLAAEAEFNPAERTGAFKSYMPADMFKS